MAFSFVRHAAGVACVALFVVSGVQCSSITAKSSASSAPASSVIGAAGGKIASSDGVLEVSIPAGALASDVTITAEVATSAATGAVGKAYVMGPNGTTFAAPVTMTFHYAAVDLGGHQASDLHLATEVAGTWQLLEGAAHDDSERTVSGTTTHFSKFAIVGAPNGVFCVPGTTMKSCDPTPADDAGPCGPSTCIHGCCSGNSCIETAEQTRCGIAGQQCMDCSPGTCTPNVPDGRGGSCNPGGSK